MSIIKTALEAGERVSSVVGVPWGGRGRLPEADALLLHAYAVYKASLCPCGCGFPAEDTLDPEADGCVRIDDDRVCAVKSAMEEWRADQKDGGVPGVLPVPVIEYDLLEVARARSTASRTPAS